MGKQQETKKLNKKQIRKAAKMWAAGILFSCGTDSFDNDFSQSGEVVEAVHDLAAKILGGENLLFELPKILDYVAAKSE